MGQDANAVVDERLRAYIADSKIDPKLGARLLVDNDRWNIDIAYTIRTRKSGVAGAIIPLAKRIVRPFVRLYTDQILNRQAQLNLVMLNCLRDSIRRTVQLELDVKQLRREVDRLARNR